MKKEFDPEETVPKDLTLSDTLRLLAEELANCTETLRETHNLIAPQLEELERLYPNALNPDDD